VRVNKGNFTRILSGNSDSKPQINRIVAIGAGVPAGLLALAAIFGALILVAYRAHKKV